MTIGKIINVGENKDTVVLMDLNELVELLRPLDIASAIRAKNHILELTGFNVLDCQQDIPDWLTLFMQEEDNDGMTLGQWKLNVEEARRR